MPADMEYDGRVLSWSGHGSFRATTGFAGFQDPNDQCVQDRGPVPEGTYLVNAFENGRAKDDGAGNCNLEAGWGVQTIPRHAAAGTCEVNWANWGSNRVRIEPADTATKNACTPHRGGFYLHDSTKGYSHGCIEVDGRFFIELHAFLKTYRRKTFKLHVKYVPGRSTDGGTKK